MSTEKSVLATTHVAAETDDPRAYWLKKLSHLDEPARLTPDFTRPAAYSGKQGEIDCTLPAPLYEQLRKLSNDSHFLIYTTLLAALAACLHRYGGSSATVVGSPARKKQEVAPRRAVALPIVNEVDERTTFRQLLLSVRETLLEAYARQEHAFPRLLRDLNLEGIENRCPLFDVALVLENIHHPLPEVKNDITIIFTIDEGELKGRMEFNDALFIKESVGRFALHFTHLLRQALADTDAPLHSLEIMTNEERQRMLVDWNGTRHDFASVSTMPILFEAQAERSPDSVAVEFGAQQLSYRELNRRANQLARYLQRCGVGAEKIVAICVERSVEMVVGMLAALKAGGTYLPLDPTYPKERLAFVLADARPSVLLTQRYLTGVLPGHDVRTVCLDQDWPEVAAESEDNIESGDIGGENAAYVIYTSGTTGQPKGVVVPHKGLCHLVQAQCREFHIHAASRLLQFASPSFDASVSEIFTALSSGATLCLCRREQILPGEPLSQTLRDEHITVVTLPPSALAVMPAEPLPSLKTLVVAGEVCSAEVAARWSGGRRFLNAYGPTEVTVCATISEDFSGREGEGRQPDIGRPIAHAQVYVLDERLRPVVVGATGELYVGGEGVARGYLHRPELTAERFIPHPYSRTGGARLYRTGDRVRYLPDGRIEYVGRGDNQVKVRGYRIELGEVEAALRSLPGVREAAVVAKGEASGGKRLVAYVVGEEDERLSTAEMRGYLAERLPEYMIPAAFVQIDEMPLTPNGKVDKRALPAPEARQPEVSGEYEAPRTPVEEVLAGIWAEVLGLERVGVNDHFLEIGGHSLLATRITSRARVAFQVDLSIQSLFETPTIAGLAKRIEAGMQTGAGVDIPAVVPVARGGELPLSFSQQRLWFLYQMEPESAVYHVPATLRLKGSLDVAAMASTINEIVRRHEVLRATFPSVDGRPYQVILPNLEIDVPVFDLGALPESEREAEAARFVLENMRRPFDLACGPMLRVTLLRMGEHEHVAAFMMHHIVSDGWSMGVLIREVAALYEAFTQGRPSPLPALPIQYADYAHWQRRWLEGEVLAEQLSYWKRQLAGAPPVLSLPLDRPRPATQSYVGVTRTLSLPAALSEGLRALSRRENVTLFMTLLAAFTTLLYRYSGQEDIVVGSPVANRNLRETEGLIGFFVNILALRTDLSGNPTFEELLARVRRASLGAYAHQDVPFERLVSELHVERKMSHAPLFQVVFVLQNIPLSPLELPGLALSSFDVDRGTTHLDLYLSITDTEQGMNWLLKYNTDLFDEETVAQLLGHYEALLNEVVARPDRRLLDISLSAGAADGRARSKQELQKTFRTTQFTF